MTFRRSRNVGLEFKEFWGISGNTSASPARLAMRYYFHVPTDAKTFRGRKRNTIVTTINRNIERTRLSYPDFDMKSIKSKSIFRNVRMKATNRKHWHKRVAVTAAAHSGTMSK